MKPLSVLYLCPLGQQHQEWRLAAAPSDVQVIMRRYPSHSEVLSLIPQTDVLISERTGVIDRQIIATGRQLKLIQRIGSLYYDIDLAAAREYGVPVAQHPIRSTIAVAEHVMMQILVLLRRAMPLQQVVHTSPEKSAFSAPQRAGDRAAVGPFTSRHTTEDVFAFNWSGQTRVSLLHRKTVGILGFGEIGTELARRLWNWGCDVLYTKRVRLPEPAEQELHVRFHSHENLLRESDVVVCLLPYFPQTDQWLNAARIAMMKPGAFLCEAGSGSVVDEQAVANALRSGHLGGAAFDTYEWEPIKQDNPLLLLAGSDPAANILLTPHIGSCNDVAVSEFPEFYSNALHVLRDQPVEGRVA